MSRIEELQAQRRKQFAAKKGDDNAPGWAAELAEDTAELWAAVSQNTKAVGQGFQELRARLGAVEQHVANLPEGGFAPAGFAGPTFGAQAVQALAEGGDLERLAKGNTRSTGALIEGVSIRAALVNEGGGSSGNGSIPSQPEQRGVVGPGLKRLRLLDVLPRRPTSHDSVTFVRVNVASGAAGEQLDEATEKAEVHLGGTPVKADIATIAAHTTISLQALSDHASLQAAIDRVLRHGVLAEIERLIIEGGEGSNTSRIEGLLPLATVFLPTIGTTPADRIGEALVRQADAGYSPNLVLLNHLDWFTIQLTRNTVETASYVFGSPLRSLADALWSTAIVPTSSMPEGTGMVLDTSFTTLLDRQQTRVEISREHGTNFTKNLVTVLAEARCGLEVIDPVAAYRFDLAGS